MKPEYVEVILFLAGLSVFGAGIGWQFGWAFFPIVVGGVLMLLMFIKIGKDQ